MAEIEESLLKRKIDNYSYSSDLKDFQAENELTVEITLNEYRELIKEKSIADYKIKEAEKDRYTRNSENEKLKKENKELEMKLFEYRKLYGELKQSEKEMESEDNE